ncbi:hypothetical protein ES702_01185 [subsurface metagenome]
MKKKILKKAFTRDLSLYFCCIWHKASTDKLKGFINDGRKNLLYIKKNNYSPVDVWQDPNDSTRIIDRIINLIKKDEKFIKNIMAISENEWNFLSRYFLKNEEIKNTNELKKFSKHLEKWIALMMINFVITDSREKIRANNKIAVNTYRKKAQEFVYSGNELFVNFFNKAFPKYKKISTYITPREAFLLSDNKLCAATLKKINKRKNGYAMLNGKLLDYDQINIQLNKKGLILEKEAVKSDLKIIKGNIANKGKVKGTAKIVMIRKEFDKFKKGDVLVASMTTPEYLPIMKIASAFVTDEGGIMCHAAIVSRELKKPCVIGTKIATQALKDGDKVEVDANKGIVKIIKKA